MLNDAQRQKNADRFTGFAEVYEEARPTFPHQAVEFVCRYLGHVPENVVDLGCGTGLSTLAWKDTAQNVTGIEPSGDMLAVARRKEGGNVQFRQGYGNQTGLPDAFADAVICSQSFHWMEPSSTLQEVDRILKPGGVFATVDCDWPPVTDWRAEKAYDDLYRKVRKLESELPDVRDSFMRYSKEKHLQNIRESGYFRYCREIVFFHTEEGSAERVIKLLLSQGSLQTIVKKHPGLLDGDLEDFRAQVVSALGEGAAQIGFCYRMRIGVK